jgi:FkbM family methyltransferase
MPDTRRAKCASTRAELNSPEARDAYRGFFLSNAYTRFWGSNSHLTVLLAALRMLVPQTPGVLIDVGAAPYNTMGGDVSHLLHYFRLWNCSGARAFVGFEPMPDSFDNLLRAFRREIAQESPPKHALRKVAPSRGGGGGGGGGSRRPPNWHIAPINGTRDCVVMRQQPASDTARAARMAPQQFAGSNTASLEQAYHGREGATVHPQTIDGTLAELGLAGLPVLVLKADVEGHEMAVLRGARQAIDKGHVQMILLEYGDKASPAIFKAMKARGVADPAAPSPQQMGTGSLHWLQGWADARGFDTFFVGEQGRRPVLVPVTGAAWDDKYEVCRDKRAKYSSNGRTWQNLSAWSPNWSAVCWYDVALVLRTSPLFEPLLLKHAKLPNAYCRSLVGGWFPHWVDSPPAEAELRCTHAMRGPADVCTSYAVGGRGAGPSREMRPPRPIGDLLGGRGAGDRGAAGRVGAVGRAGAGGLAELVGRGAAGRTVGGRAISTGLDSTWRRVGGRGAADGKAKPRGGATWTFADGTTARRNPGRAGNQGGHTRGKGNRVE